MVASRYPASNKVSPDDVIVLDIGMNDPQS